MGAMNVFTHPVHLGLGATAVAEPEFTGGMSWHEGYVARHAGDGTEGRLVGMWTFTADWDAWEMHPNGHEVVLCTAGVGTQHRPREGGRGQLGQGAGRGAA